MPGNVQQFLAFYLAEWQHGTLGPRTPGGDSTDLLTHPPQDPWILQMIRGWGKSLFLLTAFGHACCQRHCQDHHLPTVEEGWVLDLAFSGFSRASFSEALALLERNGLPNL